MKMGCAVLQAALGKMPAHFSYPIGDDSAAGTREFRLAQEVGYETAVTTRPGVLFPEHADHLAALPRLSINGEFPAAALRRGAAVRHRHRRVERLSPPQRGVTRDIQVTSGIAGQHPADPREA